MFRTSCRIAFALLLLAGAFAGTSRAEDSAPVFQLHAQLYQIDAWAAESLKRALRERSHEVRETTEDTKDHQSFVFGKSLSIDTGVLSLTIDGRSLSFGASKGVPSRLCQLLMDPRVTTRAEEKATINASTDQPLQFFRKRTDNLFEVDRESVRVGCELETTIHPADGGIALALDFALTASDVAKREPVEGVELEVGKPIAGKYETQGVIHANVVQWTLVLLPNWNESAMCLFLSAGPPNGEFPEQRQFTIASLIVRLLADAEGNLPAPPSPASTEFFAWLSQIGVQPNKPAGNPANARKLSEFAGLTFDALSQDLTAVKADLLSAPRVTTTDAGYKPCLWKEDKREEAGASQGATDPKCLLKSGSPAGPDIQNMFRLLQDTAVGALLGNAPPRGLAIIADVRNSEDPQTHAKRFGSGFAIGILAASTKEPGQVQLTLASHCAFDDFRWERRGLFQTLKRVPAGVEQRDSSTEQLLALGEYLVTAYRMPNSKDAVIMFTCVTDAGATPPPSEHRMPPEGK